MNIIPYGKHNITEDDINCVVKVLRSKPLTQGPSVLEFENAFAEYVGCKYAVAVSNGTAALHLSALALDIKPGDKIITTPNTFVASANGARYAGAEVHLVDIDPSTLCISTKKIEELLTKHPPGYFSIIFPVSFAGYPCDMESIYNLAQRFGTKVVEDACHAVGGEYQDAAGTWNKSGSCKHSDMAVFSFHPVKHIAAGEGGLITTNNEQLYHRLRLLRTHGITNDSKLFHTEDTPPWHYEMQELGYNYRLSDLHATLAHSQLSRIEENIRKRLEIATRYDNELACLPLKFYNGNSKIKHAYHLYVITCDDRLNLYNFLRDNNIYSQVHYIPIYRHPYYRDNFDVEDFPNTEKYYEGCLSIPMYHSMTNEEQSYVIETIKKFFQL